MRKDLILPGLAVGGGILGLGLRRWQLASGYDPETQLFVHGHPAFLLLLLLTAGLLLAGLLLLRGIGTRDAGPAPIRCPSPLYMTLMTASAMLFLGGGVLGLLEGAAELAFWRVDPTSHPLTYPVALILCALLSFAAGPATLLLGRGAYRGNAPAACSLWAVFPPMTALAWLFSTHLAHGTDPILMGYGFSLAAAIFLLLAHYYAAAYFHDRPHPYRAVLCALMGVFFGLVSLADSLSPFQMALTAAFTLSALAGLWALLRGSFGPPWPSRLLRARMPLGAQEDEDEDENPDGREE